MWKRVLYGILLISILLVGCMKSNQPPEVTYINAPDSVAEQSSFEVAAKASDPEGKLEKVLFEFGFNKKTGVLSGDVYKATFIAPAVDSDEDITLTVTAYDKEGNASVPVTKTITVIAKKAPEMEWQKALGGSDWDKAYSIRQTTDGGYIVAGWTTSNDGDVSGKHGEDNPDVWIIKLDSVGNTEWQKAFGGNDSDLAYSVQQTSDGGYIVAGWTTSNDGDVSGKHGGADFWVIKLGK